MYAYRQKTNFPCTYMTMYNTAHVHPQRYGKNKNAIINCPLNLSFYIMYIRWRETEHEDIDLLDDEDPTAMAALRQCSLWKFFQCTLMKGKPRLLNALVDYWHPDVEEFMIEGKSLTPTTEEIYFLTILLRRGEPINLCSFPPMPHNNVEMIGFHCEADTQKVGSQVSINRITNLSLKVIVLLIGWITGSAALHQASWVHMHCAM
jgi:hypothetical protein